MISPLIISQQGGVCMMCKVITIILQVCLMDIVVKVKRPWIVAKRTHFNRLIGDWF